MIAALFVGIAGCGRTTGERQRDRVAEERLREQEKERAQLAQVLADRDGDETKIAALVNRRDEETAAIRSAEAELAAATTVAAREAARSKVANGQAQLQQTKAELAPLQQRSIHPEFPRALPGPRKPACACQAGDPLCSCL